MATPQPPLALLVFCIPPAAAESMDPDIKGIALAFLVMSCAIALFFLCAALYFCFRGNPLESAPVHPEEHPEVVRELSELRGELRDFRNECAATDMRIAGDIADVTRTVQESFAPRERCLTALSWAPTVPGETPGPAS